MKKILKDNELEYVSGGSWMEIKELRDAFGLNMSVEHMELILKNHGIDCELKDGQYDHNKYIDIEKRKPLSHEEVIELIKQNHWYY